VRRRALAAAVLSVTLAAVIATPAAAAPGPSPNEVYWDGSYLRYHGGQGFANTLVVTGEATAIRFKDTSRIKPGAGCATIGGDVTAALCQRLVPGPQMVIDLSMSNGDDTVTTAGTGHLGQALYVHGGTGDDVITLTMANDEVTYVYGDEADDTLDRSGGWGGGYATGGPGADAICGNNTHVSYASSPQAVRASIGGAPGDDGMPGEGDTICAAVVAVTGSEYADMLVAGQQGAALRGLGGDDALFGGPGNDTLHGLHGNDAILGGGGDDTIFGLQDVDAVNGGPGTDACYPDPLDALVACEVLLPLYL